MQHVTNHKCQVKIQEVLDNVINPNRNQINHNELYIIYYIKLMSQTE